MMTGLRRILITMVLGFSCNLFAADVLPPLNNEAKLPTTEVLGTNGQRVSLIDFLKNRSGPIVLLPIFARCQGACPALTQGLRKAFIELGPSVNDVNVIIYSFDPSDDQIRMMEFAKNQNIPTSWTLVSSDSENSKRFFDALKYSYMDEDGLFLHPNQFFVFSQNLEWAATVVGTDFSSDHVRRALRMARNESSLVSTLMDQPEKLAIWGGSIFMLIVGFFFFSHMFRRHRLN